MIFFVTIITLYLSVVFSQNVTFITDICHTRIANPFKRHFFGTDLKLSFGKVGAH